MKIKMLLLLSCAWLALCTDLSANTFTVCTTKDHGCRSLREAIIIANECNEPTVIRFKLSEKDKGYNKCSKSWTIKPCTVLPTITTQVLSLQ